MSDEDVSEAGRSERVKLPVVSTATLSLQWGLVVARRHWLMVIAYAVVPFAFILIFQHFFPLRLGSRVDPWPILVLFAAVPAYSVSLVVLALVTHNEVLRGSAGLDGATLGRGGSRAFGYVFDVLLLMLAGLASLAALAGVHAVLGRWTGTGPGPSGVVVFAFFAWWVLAVLAIQRLLLRLPSRALGRTLSWRKVWRLGRGNTWRMLGCMFLITAVIGMGIGALMMPLQMSFLPYLLPVPPLAGDEAISLTPFANPDTPFALVAAAALVMGLSYPVNTVFICAFLSLSYLHLRDGTPGP